MAAKKKTTEDMATGVFRKILRKVLLEGGTGSSVVTFSDADTLETTGPQIGFVVSTDPAVIKSLREQGAPDWLDVDMGDVGE